MTDFVRGESVSVLRLPPTATQLHELVVGDFDGDGRLDLVTVDPSSLGDNTHVVFNEGGGSFAPAVSFDSGGDLDFGVTPLAILLGRDRLALLNQLDDVALGESSINFFDAGMSRTFTSGESLVGVGISPASIVAGQVTECLGGGFGGLDLVWTSVDNELHLVPGPLLGPFDIALEQTFPGSQAAGPGGSPVAVSELAVADFDGDGCNDVVVATTNFGGIGAHGEILFYSGRGGDPALELPAVVIPLTADLDIREMHVADVDDDGHLDVVMARASQDGSPLAVLFGNPTQDPPFGVLQTFGGMTCCEATGVSISDVNGDGFKDIVVANSGEPLGTRLSQPGLEIWLGSGSRSFRNSLILTEPARDVVITELDGDTKIEIAYITSNEILYFDPSRPEFPGDPPAFP